LDAFADQIDDVDACLDLVGLTQDLPCSGRFVLIASSDGPVQTAVGLLT
jgi:hypothetical protein